MNKLLTKREVFAILNEEIEKVRTLPIPTWGFHQSKIIQVLKDVRRKIENLEEK
jgi:hypothetical protein